MTESSGFSTYWKSLAILFFVKYKSDSNEFPIALFSFSLLFWTIYFHSSLLFFIIIMNYLFKTLGILLTRGNLN